jgi:anoctamin-10
MVLPFVMRFVQDWRAGKTTFKDAYNGKTSPTPTHASVESKFLAKVDDELALPDYAIFSQ